MPISPVASRRTPFSFCVRTSSAPAKTACSAWARVMAGPCVISPVPLPMRRASTPGCGAKSRTPMSTGTTAHCAACAIRHTEVRPAARLRVTAAVTLLSVWVTPWATTPLSAHSTSTARGKSGACASPVSAAMSSSAVSSRPRLPKGFAHAAQRRCACSRAASSGGVMFCSNSRSSMLPASFFAFQLHFVFNARGAFPSARRRPGPAASQKHKALHRPL